MVKYVLSVDKNKPVEIEILNNMNNEYKVVHGYLKTYRLDYDLKTTDLDLTPQEIFFRIVNFLGEVIYKAKSIGNTLVMKIDNQTSRLFVKDLTKIEDVYRVFNGELVY